MSAPPSIRVMVVDDHVSIRVGVTRLIDGERPRMEAVGSAASCCEALEGVRRLQPDVVVLDVNLAGEDGLVLIPTMRALAPCEVVVLTSMADPMLQRRAGTLGAAAFVRKTDPAEELLKHIEAVRMMLGPSSKGGEMSRGGQDQAPRDQGRMR